HVIPTKEMVDKIKVACDARSSQDFLILARTDARTAHGLDEALRRGQAYADAGADLLFIEAPESVEEMEQIGRSFDVPVLAKQLHGGRTPIVPQTQLKAMGFAAAIYPTAGLFASASVLAKVYDLLVRGESIDVPLYPFDEFAEMIGFQKVWDFEKKYADLLA